MGNSDKLDSKEKVVSGHAAKRQPRLPKPIALIASAAIALFLWYSIAKIQARTGIWWSAFVILCMAILPIWATCYALEALLSVRAGSRTHSNRIGTFVTVGFLFWFARVSTASEINAIFPFDPALIPFALTAGVFLTLSGLSAVPAALPMVGLEAVCLLVIFDRIGRKKSNIKNYVLILASMALFFGVSVSSNALAKIGLPDLRPLLIARIAYEYDFNDRHLCFVTKNGDRIPLGSGEKILFIGASQDRGIAATIKKMPEKPITKIQKGELSGLYPSGFHAVECNKP